ncbi:16S rRNA (guanine(527)-N(7))-methyltransferase RsmG [Gilvimarinus sp. F26214L]|uniref:16S rRNA (guanine(527)-N(7))-methyltransferase RsmG n=1 Tax=Gilvimarinus sp. DZF01 TaxID=3461371 RepID=UPI00404584B3
MSRSAFTIDWHKLEEELTTGYRSLNLKLDQEQVSALLTYLQLFAKWNKAYNLSAVRDPLAMVSRHLLDSLSIVPFIQGGQRWIDVGTGGGLPGVPLAIMFPGKDVTLLDSNGKKTRFLFQVKTELQLHQVNVVQSRVEAFEPELPYDAVFSRAFTSLNAFFTGCVHLLDRNGRFYAMKGQYPEDELREVSKPFNVEQCYPLRVPGETGARHLVVAGRSVDTHSNDKM